MSTFYLNGPSLSSATAVFTDNELSICAADAFYSDGVIVRQQLECSLLPPQICPACAVPCGESINGSGEQGIYLINLDAGTDTGAVIIRFDPYGVPDGIRATFNSIVYNKLTSSLDGLHEGVANDYTFVGATSSDCGISGQTYPSLDEFLYNGIEFISTGNTQSVTVNPGSVSLSASAPGSCMMVIPKSAASPSIINFEIVGPCIGTAWDITIDCPVLLTGFSSSLMAESSESACLLSLTQTYYNASLGDTPGTVDVYDFVYSDNLGSVPLEDGFYKATGSIAGSEDWFQVENGVVIAVGNCTPITYDLYLADEYNCIGCVFVTSGVTVALPTGTTPSYGNYYSSTIDSNYYVLTATASVGPGIILNTTSTLTCGPCSS